MELRTSAKLRKKVAVNYFNDDSVEAAIPPLKILLSIMAYGEYEGKEISDPELRKQFDRDVVINSDWYKERLKRKQQIDIDFNKKQIAYIESFMAEKRNSDWSEDLSLEQRLEKAKKNLAQVKTAEYLESLIGTIGADPLCRREE